MKLNKIKEEMKEIRKYIDEFKLDKNVLDKWEMLVQIKQKILAETEKLRKDKIIGSNLESSLIIKYGSNYEKALTDIDLLNIVFGSWDIKLEKSDTADEISVIAGKSSYGKCNRCWRHIDGINEDGLCQRCADAIKE